MKKCAPASIVASQLDVLKAMLSELEEQRMCQLCELAGLYGTNYEMATIEGALYDPGFSDLGTGVLWTYDQESLYEESKEAYFSFQKARAIVLTKWAANFLIITGIVPNGKLQKSCKLDTKLGLYGDAGRKVKAVLKEYLSEVAEYLEQSRKKSARQAYKQRKTIPMRQTPLKHVLWLCSMSRTK